MLPLAGEHMKYGSFDADFPPNDAAFSPVFNISPTNLGTTLVGTRETEC
jgi:hypothetical protein